MANPAVQLWQDLSSPVVRTPLLFDLAHHEQNTEQKLQVFIGLR
jgi:hypothetical protein